MKITNLIAASILLTSMSAIASEADEKYEQGEKEHKNHCYKCHGDEIYTRENSFVKTNI